MPKRNQLRLWPADAARSTPDAFRWSVSRDKRLRDCPRKYYLYHYASRGGAQAQPGTPTRTIYILKSLRNRFMWVGEIVHQLVEAALQAWRSGAAVDVDLWVERGVRKMRDQYRVSQRGVYRERPFHACGLVEHAYQDPVTPEQWLELRQRLERCVRNFFALPLLEEIRALPTWRWLALETMSSFDLDGASIVVKPDLAWRADEGIVIADWKSGRPHPEDEQLQLAVYALFAERVWGLENAPLTAKLIYLDAGQVEASVVSAAQRAEADAWIRASVMLPPSSPLRVSGRTSLIGCQA
jgi:hypothetical protein